MAAIRERIIANGSDGIADVDAGHATAAIERIVADGCDGVGSSVVSNCRRNGHISRILIAIRKNAASFKGDNGLVVVDVVVDVVDLKVVGIALAVAGNKSASSISENR